MGHLRGKVVGAAILAIAGMAALAGAQAGPEVSLLITDSAGNPLVAVSPDTNDPAIGGADFLLVLRTSDAADLVTYSQHIFFDSNRIGYANYLEPGVPGGETLVNDTGAEDGASANMVVSAMDIGGPAGPRDLARLGFEVRQNPTTGQVAAADFVLTTAPYSDLFSSGLAHTFSEPITFVTEETPFTPTPTSTATATATPTETPTLPEPTTTPTPTATLAPTPDADFNNDGKVDERDLLILIDIMRQPSPN